MNRLAFIAAFCGMAVATPAFAHITIANNTASPGSSFKAIFRVPHGCDGAETTAVKIQLPEGFIAAKPMPHAGWTLATKKADYAKSYSLYGSDVKSGVVEVDFTGGNLPDEYYDEFVVTGTVADSFKPGDVVFFPVVQECGTAADRWIEIPKAGQAIDDLKLPAPHLDIVAKAK
jgi:periplasmic copper chaperone A